jgi:hypothetical protein
MIAIPEKVFLDTSVVNFMCNYCDEIHDNCEIPSHLTSRVQRDIDALRGIWKTGSRAHWQIVISKNTLREVHQTHDADKRERLLNWAGEIVAYQGGLKKTRASNLPSPITTEALLSTLPDIPDRILIKDALMSECDTFCTRDWKTLLRYRKQLHQLPLRFLAPHEWRECIKPYAGL